MSHRNQKTEAQARYLAFLERQKKRNKRRLLPTSHSRAASPQHKPQAPAVSVPDVSVLIIGIEYVRYDRQRRASRLPGCHKDVAIAQSLMQHVMKIPAASMRILADDGRHPVPNKAAITSGLKWLMNTGKTHLWVFYSGHGTSIFDANGDEIDGRDEALVPEDYLESGVLSDDYLGAFANSVASAGKYLNCVFDCCHSGSVMDLPFYHWSKDNASQQHVATLNVPSSSGANGNHVVCISACADNQTSVSAYNLDQRRSWQGALMYAFDQAFRRHVKSASQKVDAKKLIVDIGKIIAAKGYSQITVLSTAADMSASESAPMFPL